MHVPLVLFLLMGCGSDDEDPDDPTNQKVIMLTQHAPQADREIGPTFRRRRKHRQRVASETSQRSLDAEVSLLKADVQSSQFDEDALVVNLLGDDPKELPDPVKELDTPHTVERVDLLTEHFDEGLWEEEVFEGETDTARHTSQDPLGEPALDKGVGEEEDVLSHVPTDTAFDTDQLKPRTEYVEETLQLDDSNHFDSVDPELDADSFDTASKSVHSSHSRDLEELRIKPEDSLEISEHDSLHVQEDVQRVLDDERGKRQLETLEPDRLIFPSRLVEEQLIEHGIIDFVSHEGSGTDDRLMGAVWTANRCVGLGTAKVTEFLSLIAEKPNLFYSSLVAEVSQYHRAYASKGAEVIEELRRTLHRVTRTDWSGKIKAHTFPVFQGLGNGIRNLVSRMTPKMIATGIIVSACMLWYGLTRAGILHADFSEQFPFLVSTFRTMVDPHAVGTAFVDSLTQAVEANSLRLQDCRQALAYFSTEYSVGKLVPLLYSAATSFGVGWWVLRNQSNEPKINFSNSSSPLLWGGPEDEFPLANFDNSSLLLVEETSGGTNFVTDSPPAFSPLPFNGFTNADLGMSHVDGSNKIAYFTQLPLKAEIVESELPQTPPKPISLLPPEEQRAIQQQLNGAGITGDILIENADGSAVKCLNGGTVCSKEKSIVFVTPEGLPIPAVSIADFETLSNLESCPFLKIFLDSQDFRPVSAIDPHALFELQLKARDKFVEDANLQELIVGFGEEGISFPRIGNPTMATAEQLFGDVVNAENFLPVLEEEELVEEDDLVVDASDDTSEDPIETVSPVHTTEDPIETVSQDPNELEDQSSSPVAAAVVQKSVWQEWAGALRGWIAVGKEWTSVWSYWGRLGQKWSQAGILATTLENPKNFEIVKDAAIAYVQECWDTRGLFTLSLGRGLFVENNLGKLLSSEEVSQLLASNPTLPVHKSNVLLVAVQQTIAAMEFARTPTVETLSPLIPWLVKMALTRLHLWDTNALVIRMPGAEVALEVLSDGSWKLLRKDVNYDMEKTAPWTVDIGHLLPKTVTSVRFSSPSRIPWNDDSLFWYRPSFALLTDRVINELKREALNIWGEGTGTLVIRFPASKVGVAFRSDGQMRRLETAIELESMISTKHAQAVTLMDLVKEIVVKGPREPKIQGPKIVIKKTVPTSLESLSESTIAEMLLLAQPWFADHPNIWRLVLRLPNPEHGIVLASDGTYFLLPDSRNITRVKSWDDTLEGTLSCGEEVEPT